MHDNHLKPGMQAPGAVGSGIFGRLVMSVDIQNKSIHAEQGPQDWDRAIRARCGMNNSGWGPKTASDEIGTRGWVLRSLRWLMTYAGHRRGGDQN